jgi:quercetin dioxygenase-like cupin family protein
MRPGEKNTRLEAAFTGRQGSLPPRNEAIMKHETETKSKGLVGVQVARAAELINYQDGAIVSRELVKKPTGTVTVFAFDEGQGLSEHTAPFDALVQVLEGEAEIMISGKPHHLADGELILMPAHQPHALKAFTRFKMLLTMIRS